MKAEITLALGYPKPQLSRLFRLFDTAIAVPALGCLYVCKNIIEAHGGKIWGKNNDQGKRGATFSFSLPLALTARNI